MKKSVVALFFSFILLDASSIKVNLIDNIINLLFPNQKISLFSQDKEYIAGNESKYFVVVDDCSDAKIIIVKSMKSISKKCLKKIRYIIVTSYGSYKEDAHPIGAIFWQKGRLNLIFRKKRLEELSLSLPKRYNKYIE